MPQWSMSAALSISLQLNYSMIEGMKNTRLDYEAGLLSYEKAKAQLERDVRKSYYNMLLLQENIKLKKESYAAAERQEETARASYRAGLAPELTLLQAQVAKENQKPELDELENNFKMLMAQFANNLGLPYDTAFELIPAEASVNFIPLDVKELVSKAAGNRPDIQEIKQNILLLESTRKKTRLSMYTPTLGLSWNIAPTFNEDPWKDAWFGKDKWTDRGSFSITLSFSLTSLLPWSAGAQGVKDINDGIKNLNIGLGQAVRGTELEVYNQILALQKIQASIEAMQKTADLAQRSYESTERAYRGGQQTLLQVQSAEDQLNQAKLGVLAQNFNYFLGLIDLEYIIGVPFGTLSGR
jgi:outer membrane protein TolC